MTLTEYIDGARRTESSKSPLNAEVVNLGLTNRMLHGIVGICTEMGEIVEAYEKPQTDYINVAEEIGDAFWYTAVLLDELGIVALEADENIKIEAQDLPLRLLALSAEMLDKTKKTMFYGKEYNVDNLREQIGVFYAHLVYFVKGLQDVLDVNKEKIWVINLNKLKIRYPEKFNLNDAEVRDLAKERIILEAV